MSKSRSKLSFGDPAAPTMIIPNGTLIETDAHGQLSIRTPGNLVIQNSGSYSTLESVTGSIRIEPNVRVEAVSVRCAETCFVQGSLTAWQVKAKTLHLDGTAQAHVMLQETERLEVDRDARLVGNFHSEKELYMLFSRFASQVRTLPFGTSRSDDEAPAALDADVGTSSVEADLAGAEPVGELEPLPEPLFFALVLLEREIGRGHHGPSAKRILEELCKLLREQDLEALQHTYKTLFGRVPEAGGDVDKARGLVASHFALSDSGP